MSFRNRSDQKELLDEENIPTDELHRNLVELDIINRYLGGYRASNNGLREVIQNNPGVNTVLDIGFGNGEVIQYFSKLAKTLNTDLFFYGVDTKQDCLDFAELNLSRIPNK